MFMNLYILVKNLLNNNQFYNSISINIIIKLMEPISNININKEEKQEQNDSFITIRIDVRETDLIAKCETLSKLFSNIKLVKEQLPIGDVIINDGAEELLIIERKTITDLAASIKDGRYEEQSYRLNGLPHHNHNIIYLIEGDLNRFNGFRERIDKQTLYSAMFSINYYKGFSLMRSLSVDETAAIICNMGQKIGKEQKIGKDKKKSSFYSNSCKQVSDPTQIVETGKAVEVEVEEVAEPTSKDYCKVVKKVKKDNITAENIGEIMLCQIPGISSASALAILEQFKTLPNLIKCINEDKMCLNNVTTKDANGKSRKISKTVVSTILLYFSTTEN
jgi:ERCC4-type nuclease